MVGAPRLAVWLVILLIPILGLFPAIKDLGRVPGQALVLANLLGRKFLERIEPARIPASAKTQFGILAGPSQQDRPFRNPAKASAITEAAVDGEHDYLIAASGLIELPPELLGHLDPAAG